MYSNTINIVHSHFRRKEPLYYLFRPHFCHEQTPVLGTYSFQKCLKQLNHEATRTRNQGPCDCQSRTNVTNACQPLALVPVVDPAMHPE